MKNLFSAIILPFPGFAFTRAERNVRQFILVFGLILVHLTGYSQPAERRDTLKDGAVVFRPMSDTYTKVTVPRAGGPSSREDYIRLMNETPCDKHTQSQYNRDVALVVQTVEARNRIRDTILSVLPVEKLEGIPRILMEMVLSPSGQIEWITFYSTRAMQQQWTAEDYQKLDRVLRSSVFYTPWKGRIPYCIFMEAIPLSDGRIHLDMSVDEHFDKVTLLLTNRFEDKVIWASYPPMIAEIGNTGIKVDFRDRSQTLWTWKYPFQEVGQPFYSAFTVESLETVRMEADLAAVSGKFRDALESIKITVGFLMLHPATGKGYEVLDSFVLDRTENKRSAKLNLRPQAE